jgi:hypothetical protein
MKKIFVSAVATLFVLAGCSGNKSPEAGNSSADYLSLDATATRAAIVNVSTLQTDMAGFKVYGTAADAPDVWYNGGSGQVIDGTNNHVFGTDSQWNFVTRVKWPSSATAYPMNFYACYPASPAGLYMTSETPDNLTGTYTVQPTAAAQVDFLAAHAATGAVKPANDMLNITFKHLLSKVDYGFHVENDYEAHVQAVVVENVANERVYDFINENWTTASEPTAAQCNNSYLYSGLLDGGQTAINGSVLTFTGNGNNTPIYTAADNAGLMLMPQNISAQTWVPNSDVPGSKSHVRVVYRLQKSEEPDYIGYADATRHPDYAGSQAETDNYTGALYIVVGYPFTLDWEAGKGYTYNIVLPGETGGILLEDTFFDENGRPTTLEVPNLDPGDMMLGDGYIHLIPEVEDWNDQPANDLI